MPCFDPVHALDHYLHPVHISLRVLLLPACPTQAEARLDKLSRLLGPGDFEAAAGLIRRKSVPAVMTVRLVADEPASAASTGRLGRFLPRPITQSQSGPAIERPLPTRTAAEVSSQDDSMPSIILGFAVKRLLIL